MVNNPMALREMAAKCWDIYKARNDSVITDLFAGMYKSTVVCPVCDKVSIIFDPFNNLTLQLPIENVWSRNFNYFPIHSQPFSVGVDIDKNSTFKALKEQLAKKTGADMRKLIIAEIYRNRFYKVFKDEDTMLKSAYKMAISSAFLNLKICPRTGLDQRSKFRRETCFT